MRKLLYGLAVGAIFGLTLAAALLPRSAPAQPEALQPTVKEEGKNGELTVRVTPEMVRYSRTRYALYFAGTLVHALALLILLRSGVSARLRDLAERKGKIGLAQAFIYVPLLMAAYGLLTLPLTFYSSFLLPHQYGLSTQRLEGWLLDQAKGAGISILITSPVVALLYWTLRRKPATWWFGFWLASIPLIVFSVVVAPLVVDPLFNRFRPLPDSPLKQRILELAGQAGIERSRVFEVDASQRTKAINAYVTGLGGSARIVLWDNLLNKLDDDEVAFIMAHEMGHYVERHVPIGVAISIAGSLFVLLLTDRLAHLLIRRQGDRWQVRDLQDLASLPVLMLILMLINFFGSPVESAISRTIESRADTFGLRLTGDGRAAASAFIKLSEMNLSHPSPPPFIKYWMFSHPPLQERIDKALAAGTEQPGQATDFAD